MRKEPDLLDLGGWGTAGVFAAMVCSLVVFALVVTGLVLLVRPVFRSGTSSGRPPADHTSGLSIDGETSSGTREG